MYGCIAEKLGHSFSKEIHNRLFDYDYELLELSPDELDSFMRAKPFKAINVTIPYKEAVIPYLDEVSEVARKIGAVNTIVHDNGYLKGYNTDFSGLSALIEKNSISLQGKKVLILGSGGTSKTALAVAESMECRAAYRVSRDKKEGCITYAEAERLHRDAEVMINTTPVGMYPNLYCSPVDLEAYPKLCAIVDAVYNPLRSKLVYDGQKKGIQAVGGLYMLVAQAAKAAEKFLGQAVSTSEIDRVYRELLLLKANVVLIGVRGSGKTTIGKRLAEELGADFIDTDEEIVKREQTSIPKIFAELGEAGFRRIESEVIRSVSMMQHAVIATGGGAVLNSVNMELLGENGRIYFIDRPLESLIATDDRPLSSNRADLEKRFKERYEKYCASCDAHICIGDDVNENIKKIKEEFCHENIGY